MCVLRTLTSYLVSCVQPWLQACVRKTHSAAASMHSASWAGVAQRAAREASATVSQAAVVPTVAAPEESGAFPGLYPAGLAATMIPTRPWLGVLRMLRCPPLLGLSKLHMQFTRVRPLRPYGLPCCAVHAAVCTQESLM